MNSITSFTHAVIKSYEHFPEEDSFLVVVSAPDEPIEGSQTAIKYDPEQSPVVSVWTGSGDQRLQVRVPEDTFNEALRALNSTGADSLSGLNVLFSKAQQQSAIDAGTGVLTVDTFEVLPPPEAVS